MKTMRRIFSILLVAALMLSLTLAVFADATTPHTITVENPDAGEAHTYTAYQIFAGDYDAETGALSNVSWGSGVNGLALLEALKQLPDFANCDTAAQVVKVLAEYENDSEQLRAFAAVVDQYTTTPAGSATGDAENPAVIDVVGDGYYYVKDTSENLTVDTYSDYILLVEGDVTVTAKDTTGVTSEKKVKDINDSTLVGSDWQDSADYDIGDPVPFQLKGTVAADYDKYNSYKLIFHDKESKGLTFDHITGVFVDGEEITEGFELITDCEDECTFEVKFENLKLIEAVKAGSVITVEYESILNEDAVIGVPGNPNEMCMEYSNNPTDESSTGTTPWDKVVVFTYEVIVNKVDENGEPLTGAAFELWKWIPDSEDNTEPEPWDECENGVGEHGHWVLIPGEVNGEESTEGNGRILKINGRIVDMYEDPATGEIFCHWVDRLPEATEDKDIYAKLSWFDSLTPEMIALNPRVPTYSMTADGLVQDPTTGGGYGYFLDSVVRESNAGTTFTWKGVDDGHYVIVETVTPPGYNTLDPIEFDVIAEHEEESQDPVLISVEGDPFMPTEENMGILVADIENHSGGILPTTGGIGTTLFYVLGGMLVLGAGVLLVIKKFSDAN